MDYNIEPVAPDDYPEIVEVWETFVRATHYFITEETFNFSSR